MDDAEQIAELRQYCSGAVLKAEGGCNFIYLPRLPIPVGNSFQERDALLSLEAHSGYASRLYLSAQIVERGQNWTVHNVLGRTWHTPSWNEVMPGRPVEMLLQHFRAYR